MIPAMTASNSSASYSANGAKPLIRFVFAAFAWNLCNGSAVAQDFPSRPLHFIMPSAGGGTDIMTRLLGAHLTESLGQQVLVENRPGGNGMVAVTAFKGMRRDGHALLMINPFIGANQALYDQLPYDYRKDFEPVAVAFHNYFYFVSSVDGPIKTLKDLIAYAKAKPGAVNFGAPVSSISQRMWVEVFNRELGLKMTFIGYKTATAAVQALRAGDIQLMNVGLPAIGPIAKAGKANLIALGAPRRSPTTPEVPTVEEAGGPRGFVSDSWVGYVTHAGVPQANVQRLNKAILAALREPKVKQFFSDNDYSIMDLSPAEFRALIEKDTELYVRIIRQMGLKPE